MLDLLTKAQTPEPGREVAPAPAAPVKRNYAAATGKKAFTVYFDPGAHELLEDIVRSRRGETSTYTERKFKLHDWVLEAIDEKLQRQGEPSLKKLRERA